MFAVLSECNNHHQFILVSQTRTILGNRLVSISKMQFLRKVGSFQLGTTYLIIYVLSSGHD